MNMDAHCRASCTASIDGTIHHSHVMCVYIHYCISIMETYWIICFMSNITPMLNVQYILTHIQCTGEYTVQCLDYNLWNSVGHHNIDVVHSAWCVFFFISSLSHSLSSSLYFVFVKCSNVWNDQMLNIFWDAGKICCMNNRD